MAATSPAAPLAHGTKFGREAEAVVAGATARPRTAAPDPIANFISVVNLMGYSLVVIPRMYPLVFYPRAETALVAPAFMLSDVAGNSKGGSLPVDLGTSTTCRVDQAVRAGDGP